MSLLEEIERADQIRGLEEKDLRALAGESRAFLIESILKNGGHFSGNLGVVELTIALLHLLDLENDTLVWDVGHQAYLYKYFTGRKDQFDTIRRHSGLSGFPKMSESKYDFFGTGHSSTSVSASLGMAEADRIKGFKNRHVAVIGDGSLTGGMAWEALNNLGVSSANITVVINDNQIGIDANDGAIGKILNELGSGGENNVFEAFGLPYFGPADGHDMAATLDVLQNAFSKEGPSIVHVRTVKGKGYEPAEKEQPKWHSVKYVKVGNEPGYTGYTGPKYQKVFGKVLCEIAEADNSVVGITPAMPSGSSMDEMMARFPKRTFDVGIAEQHAVTFAAGLAAQGLVPFCNIYSTFLQRAYDQLIHDVGLQDIPVRFCVDRAGVVGEDGPTHHGLYDLAFLKTVPNLVTMAPMNADELTAMMHFSHQYSDHPTAIRYPRGKAPEPRGESEVPIELGKGRWLRQGEKGAVLSIGHVGNEVEKALETLQLEGLQVGHADMRFASPVDYKLLNEAARSYKVVIIVEDGIAAGGFGSSVLEYLNAAEFGGKVVIVGLPNEIIEQDSREGQYARYGLSADGLKNTIREEILRASV